MHEPAWLVASQLNRLTPNVVDVDVDVEINVDTDIDEPGP
jgi:hypothetical protein